MLPVTSELQDAPLFRIDVAPTLENGLSRPAQIMVDKTQTVRREKAGQVIGHLEENTLLQVNRSLFVWLGLA